MRHIELKCKHHPDLRWHAKSIAVGPDGSYNQRRNIFFSGLHNPDQELDDLIYEDGEVVKECQCSPKDLTFANEQEKEKWKQDRREM